MHWYGTFDLKAAQTGQTIQPPTPPTEWIYAMSSHHPLHKLEKPKPPLAPDNRRMAGRTGRALRLVPPAPGGQRLETRQPEDDG
jgi:hypothetical protein